MFEYKGCKGERQGRLWVITFEDGSKTVSCHLSIALMLCRGELKRRVNG